MPPLLQSLPSHPLKLHDTFLSLDAARTAIKTYILDDGESFKTLKSDKNRYVIACKDDSCKFRIRVSRSKKDIVSITVFEPHSCSPATHYKNKQSQSVIYAIPILLL